MPMLPSGRHVGLQDVSLEALIDQSVDGPFVHKLMAIESIEQLAPYVDVVYFRPREDGALTAHKVADRNHMPPAGLVQVPSGFTLATIRDELAAWSEADQAAFMDFLQSERCRKYLDLLLARVTVVKQAILEHGNFEQQVMAHWWQEGVHPLQTEGKDD
jgi:hypothetical protein